MKKYDKIREADGRTDRQNRQIKRKKRGGGRGRGRWGAQREMLMFYAQSVGKVTSRQRRSKGREVEH